MEKKLIYLGINHLFNIFIFILGLKDSKLLTPKKRELFYQFIKTNGIYFFYKR